jgi:L,D-transpeptidase ErfK/SrfK
MLFFWEDGALAGAWPVALGRPGWRTPLGDFQVLTKETDPTWDVPPSIQEEMRQKGQPVLTKVPPCPDNPLGKYWIGTTLPGVGIHGTPAPTSIYRHVTHGCIRLHPDSIAALFTRVTVGLAGRIDYVPVLLARTPEGIFVEAHRDVYRRGRGDPMTALRVLANDAGVAAEIDWKAAHDVLRVREGIARRVGPVFDERTAR